MEKEEEDEEGEEEEEEEEEEIVVGPKTHIFEEYQYQTLRQRISAELVMVEKLCKTKVYSYKKDEIYQNLS